MNIVLLEPEIPGNTGAIGRTCVLTNTKLHLIRPMGFIINDKNIKKAGLDYWQDLDVTIYDNYEEFLLVNNNPDIIMSTTKAKKTYSQVNYSKDCFIMFGKESGGIPEMILKNNYDNCVRIPMYKNYRSINLSNSVSIILFEALRQNNFEGLEFHGEFHNK